jgi:hypothetical protein
MKSYSPMTGFHPSSSSFWIIAEGLAPSLLNDILR